MRGHCNVRENCVDPNDWSGCWSDEEGDCDCDCPACVTARAIEERCQQRDYEESLDRLGREVGS